MKKLITILVLALFVGQASFAQVTGMCRHHGHHEGKMTKKERHKMVKDLHLTSAQKSQWKASKGEFKSRAQAIKSDASLTEDQKKEKLKELKMERMQKMKSILTPEQIEIFKKDMKEHH